MQQIFHEMDGVMQRNRETRRRNMRIRTYKIVPLVPRTGEIRYRSWSTSTRRTLPSIQKIGLGRLAARRYWMFQKGRTNNVWRYTKKCVVILNLFYGIFSLIISKTPTPGFPDGIISVGALQPLQ